MVPTVLAEFSCGFRSPGGERFFFIKSLEHGEPCLEKTSMPWGSAARFRRITQNCRSDDHIGHRSGGVELAMRKVVDSKTPPNPPPTVQDNGGNTGTTKKPSEGNPVNDWVCLHRVWLLPLSYPASVSTEYRENA